MTTLVWGKNNFRTQDQAVHVQCRMEPANAVHATLGSPRHDEQVRWSQVDHQQDMVFKESLLIVC